MFWLTFVEYNFFSYIYWDKMFMSCQVKLHDLLLSPRVDPSRISYRWNSKDSSNPTRWDAGRNELLSWDNLERCTKILTPCWHSSKERRNQWTCSLQCPTYSVLFLDGWWSWWYVYLFLLQLKSNHRNVCTFHYNVIFTLLCTLKCAFHALYVLLTLDSPNLDCMKSQGYSWSYTRCMFTC